MPDEKLLQKAKHNAYALLRMRPRSEREMRERLRMKGYDDPVIDEVVGFLRRTKDLDDKKFARVWVESRMHRNPVGDIVLRQELQEKGVSASIIDEVLEEKASSYDEYSIASAMARERYERLKKLDRRKATKRLYDFLVRRGFKFDIVEKIIDEMAR